MTEVTNGAAVKETHRHYTLDFKRRIVEETFPAGSSVSIVARRHDINANLVFSWRKKYREGTLIDVRKAVKGALPRADLVRIGVIDGDGVLQPDDAKAPVTSLPAPHPMEHSAREHGPMTKAGRVEIELPNGVKVRVDGSVGEEELRCVLAAARALA